ncbi:hypothetical protein PILCRDRAFT_471576 [Piloderma croceum F 1598]|uniref:Uncharacterized protein n=1 Tax=Piloderma croceum (strain F 1598) TaxID=765440 RepID=A0A0C3B7I9_PILCF|nr:hypothetical protein PILCRDRAFT_471576 [Piloderma croceum F 1598]
MFSYSNRTKEGWAYEQSSVTPYVFTSLTTTSTKFSVTVRALRISPLRRTTRRPNLPLPPTRPHASTRTWQKITFG